jgi:hypothetical protein
VTHKSRVFSDGQWHQDKHMKDQKTNLFIRTGIQKPQRWSNGSLCILGSCKIVGSKPRSRIRIVEHLANILQRSRANLVTMFVPPLMSLVNNISNAGEKLKCEL